MKICRKCGLQKPLSAFEQKGLNKNGTKKYRGKCRACIKDIKGIVNKTFVGPPKPKHIARLQSYKRNPEKFRERQRLYSARNPDRIKRYQKNMGDLTPEQAAKRRKHRRELNRLRRLTNPNYMLACRLRARLQKFLQNKPASTNQLLGCTWQEFSDYIASKFLPGMNWSNYSLWHIDHIVPLSWFNLTDEQQFRDACHYTNLQPLWANSNLKKGNRHAG